MSILDQVRKKYGPAIAGTDRADRSTVGPPSVGSVGARRRDTEFFTSGGEAPADPRDLRPFFRHALRLGLLVVCERCRHWSPVARGDADGWCGQYETETWGRVPFACGGYESGEGEVP